MQVLLYLFYGLLCQLCIYLIGYVVLYVILNIGTLKILKKICQIVYILHLPFIIHLKFGNLQKDIILQHSKDEILRCSCGKKLELAQQYSHLSWFSPFCTSCLIHKEPYIRVPKYIPEEQYERYIKLSYPNNKIYDFKI